MNDKIISSIPVVDSENNLNGIITRTDIVKASLETKKELVPYILICTSGYAFMIYSVWCHYCLASMNVSVSVVIVSVISIMVMWVVVTIISIMVMWEVASVMSVYDYDC